LPARRGKIALQPGLRYFFPTFLTFLGQRGLWLEHLFVYPQLRRRGLERQLLANLPTLVAAETAALRGSVLDWNAPAIKFYERMGATLLRERISCA